MQKAVERQAQKAFCHQKTEQIKYIKVLMNPLKIYKFKDLETTLNNQGYKNINLSTVNYNYFIRKSPLLAQVWGPYIST
jgi:hypothetical protein